MDAFLTARYERLFHEHGVGGNPIILDIKSDIAHFIEKKHLRIDAAFFLLINFDHMVFRALSGYIPKAESALGDPMESIFSDEKLRDRANSCLDLIVNGLQNSASAHDVLKAIDTVWSQIGEILSWA